MKIVYLDQAGSGITEDVDIPDGSTVEDLLMMKKNTRSMSDFNVYINQDKANPGQVLSLGDMVSVTPKKYGGA